VLTVAGFAAASWSHG